MGYQHRARKATCGNCKKQVAWFWTGDKTISNKWACDCGATNYLKELPDWPEIPRVLYIGPEKFQRFKVYPIPLGTANEEWAQPYSIRSFVYQASRAFGGCSYQCEKRGVVMDEIVFTDRCYEQVSDDWYSSEPPDSWDCHMVGGWITGQETCPLWEQIAKLCQTDTERKFLHRYLGYVKDRLYPMLIPQTWVGIAERRRPDFVALVPLQYWNYKRVAIQLDGAHSLEQATDDSIRDNDVRSQGYEPINLKPNEKGYLEEVRRLVEQFENWMTLAQTSPWQVAVETKVTQTIKPEDAIPF